MKKNSYVVIATNLALIVLLGARFVSSQTKKEKIYPEQGKVLQMRIASPEDASGANVVAHNNGKRAQVVSAGGPIYRVATESKIYEFQSRAAKDRLEVGAQIQFRVDRDFAYIELGSKEAKYRVVSIELKPAN